MSRGMHMDMRALTSSIIWLVGFYWGPMLAVLWLKRRVKSLGRNRILVDFPLYVGLMWVGIYWINSQLSQMFDDYNISLFDQFFSAWLWGGFFYGMYRAWWLIKDIQRERDLRKQANIDALKAKLNPHFLFNCLNTISSFIHTDPDKADETLCQLAEVLRYSLDTHQNEQVTLATELTALESYLQIEGTRFGPNLRVHFNIEPETKNALVPPMLLQPLLENSLKHVKIRPLELTLEAAVKDSVLELKIMDNGAGFPPKVLQSQGGNGHGLAICQQRVSLLKDGQFELINQSGALVVIRCAFTTESDESSNELSGKSMAENIMEPRPHA